jgi:hypothetical protein
LISIELTFCKLTIFFLLIKQLLICYFHLIITVNTQVQTPVTSTHAVDPARPLQAEDDAGTDDFCTWTFVTYITNPPDFTDPMSSTTGTLMISIR